MPDVNQATNWKKLIALADELSLSAWVEGETNKSALNVALNVMSGIKKGEANKAHTAYWVKHQIEYESGLYISENTALLAWKYFNLPINKRGDFLFVRSDPLLKKWITRRGCKPIIKER